MSKAIVSNAKSNKYSDGYCVNDYEWKIGGTTMTDLFFPQNAWKMMKNNSGAGGWNLLDIGGPGSGISLREGRRVDVRKVDCRIEMLIPGSEGVIDAIYPASLEFVMVLDKQANGAAPSSAWFEKEAMNSHINLDNLGRYEILKRKRIYNQYNPGSTNNNTLTTGAIGSRVFRFTMKKMFKRPLRVNFNSTATTGSGLSFNATVDNSITIWAIHDVYGTGTAGVAPTGHTIAVTLDWRTTFQDAS